MSSKAPIGGDEALKKEFQEVLMGDRSCFGFIQVGIDLAAQKFEMVKSVRTKAVTSDWSEMKALAEERKHTYFVTVDGTERGMADGKCLLIHWGPDLSPVKDRMVYASSRATLRGYLGNTNFSTPDYFASTAEELTLDYFVKQRSLHKDIDFRSEEEKEKEAATLESAAKSSSQSIMQRLPVTFDDSAKASIQAFKTGSSKCAIITLSGTDLEFVSGVSHADGSLDFVKSQLKSDSPCYVLFWHTRARGAVEGDDPDAPLTKSVFGYYCPESANRTHKFTYSTCKANITDYCQSSDLKIDGKVEFTNAKDLNVAMLDYNLFAVTTRKEHHAKPAAPGGKKSRKKRAKLDV